MVCNKKVRKQMKRLGLFLWASAAPTSSPCSRGRHTSMSSAPARHSFWTGPSDASSGDYNRMDCAARVAFSILGQGLPLQAPGICGLRVRPPPTHGLGATRPAGHPWHTLIQREDREHQTQPPAAQIFASQIPARSPRPDQFKGLGAFPGRAGVGGILKATGHGAELLLGPGACSTAHVWILPASRLERWLQGWLDSLAISCPLVWAPPFWPIQLAAASF